MKSIRYGLIGLLVLCTYSQVTAQTHECERLKSLYGLHYNNGNHHKAFHFWKQFIQACPATDTACPCHGIEDWQRGAHSVRQLLVWAEGDRLWSLKDTLYMIYETQINAFGDTSLYYQLGRTLIDDPRYLDRAYFWLSKAVKQPRISNHALIAYFHTLIARRKTGKIGCQSIIDEYWEYDGLIDERAREDTIWIGTRGEIKARIAPCLSCNNVKLLVDRQLPIIEAIDSCSKKVWQLDRWLNLLGSMACPNTKIIADLEMTRYACKPDAASAFKLGMRTYREEQYATALTYFKETLALTENPDTLARARYKSALSLYQLGRYGEAMSFSRRAAQVLPEAHKVTADCILKTRNCGNTDIQRRSVYWLAADYYEKAGVPVPDRIKRQYPKTKDAFTKEGFTGGETFKVPCYDEMTTVRLR